MDDTILCLAIGGGVLVLWLSNRYWRQAVLVFVIWILFEGAFRKWVPGMGKAGFFLGHMILAGAYLGFLSQRGRRGGRLIPSAPFNVILLALFLWGMVELLNTGDLGILVWLLGMVTYFYYVPLAYLVPEVFPSKKKLIAFLELFCLATLPLLVLGIIQYYSPGSSWLNSQPWGGNKYIYYTGGHVRITSTFASVGAYAVFLPFLVLTSVCLLSLKRLSKKLTIVFYAILSGAFLNVFMTGCRSAVGYSIILPLLYLLLSGTISMSAIRRLAPRIAIGGALIFMMLTLTSMGQNAVRSLQARGFEDIPLRLEWDATFYRFNDRISFMGTGIGSTYQGRQEITDGATGVPREAHDEVERVLVEIGPLGFALAYGLRAVVFWQLWLLVRRLRDQDLRHLALAGCLFAAVMFQAPMILNYVNHKLFWFVAGWLLLLPKLDAQSCLKHPCVGPG